jgi:hypothetical protein
VAGKKYITEKNGRDPENDKEWSHCAHGSGVPRNSLSGGGFNKFSSGQRAKRMLIWGGSPLVRGSTPLAN